MNLPKELLEALGFEEGQADAAGVNPAAFAYQENAVRLLRETDRNILVIAPTGAGKTSVGIEALRFYGRGVYVAPTRALCHEKRREIQAAFPDARVAIGNKDYSLNVPGFNGVPFRVVTPWKLGVIAANNPDFLQKCPVVVVDEIHNLDPDMELLLTEVMQRHQGVRIVALSATIHNDDEAMLARWLGNALIVHGLLRPVPLVARIVHFDADIDDVGEEVTAIRVIEGGVLQGRSENPGPTNLVGRVSHAISEIRNGQGDGSPILVYTPYRERARSIAEALAEACGAGSAELRQAAERLPKDAGDFTDTLKAILPKGVGLHHGGCSAIERETVYELAREGKLGIVVTCQTLAQGVNLPARHVIIESVYQEPRGGQGGEKQLIDCSLFWQVAGRAGRPQFDSIGYLWVLIESELERVEVEEVLLKNKASKIVSRIYDEYFLAARLPGLIRAGWTTPERLVDFLRSTFFGAVLQDVEPLVGQFERLVTDLCERGFARSFGSRLVLTNRGQRLARLGFHPSEFEAIEGLLAQDASYEEWVRTLASLVAEHVLGRVAEEAEIADVVTFGMTAHTVKTSHAVREVADYASRLLELTMSLLHFDRVERQFEFRFKREVADRFQFGEQGIARQLAAVIGRVGVRRLMRTFGPLEESDEATGEKRVLVFDDPGLRQLAQILWAGNETTPHPDKVVRVAGILEVTVARMNRAIAAIEENGNEPAAAACA